MSYILDALRRAEAERERERGQLPGLHSRPPGLADRGSNPPRTLAWMTGLAAAGLVIAAAATWLLWRTPAAQAPVAPGPAMAAAANQAPLVTAPAPTLEPPATPIQPAPTPAPPPVAPRTTAAPAPPAADSAPGLSRGAPSPRTAAQAAAAQRATPPASAAHAPAHVPALAELPPELRGQLPRLVLSGLVHSPNPAHRMLILNGQVVHEGDRPAPDLLLEEIRPQGAVFSFRGQRFSLTQ